MHKAPAFFVLAVSLAALSLQAATFTVTNTNASGPGSLAEAMTTANLVPNSKIVFDLPGPPR